MDSTQQPTARRIFAAVLVGVLVAAAAVVSPMFPLHVMVLFMVPMWVGLVGWAIVSEQMEKRRLAAS